MPLSPQQREQGLAYLRQQLARQGVDPQAASAVFAVEGASGAIGDNGHAFGPGQFNDAGGVWTGRYPGMTPEQKNQAAWSRAGLAELAQRVAAVAGGMQGPAAIRAIVNRFERPRDPQGEIARALGVYGGGGMASAAPAGMAPTPTASGVSPSGGGSPFIQSLLQTTSNILGVPAVQLPRIQAPAAPPPQPAAGVAAPPRVATSTGAAGYQIAELLHEGVGGPTRSTGEHIHAAFNDPQSTLRAIRLAEQLGLSVRENPYTDHVDPVHSKSSYHYQTFPGLYQGRKLGEAVDVSGPRMLDFYRRLGGR